MTELLEKSALTGQWTLDPVRSTVSLRNRAMWGLAPVKGTFGQISGHGTVSPDGAVSGALTLGATSIDTKNARRDKHLRSADFLDTENHPDITFTVDNIKLARQVVTFLGMLTVRGRSKPITFEGTAATRGDAEVCLDAVAEVSQIDFGLTWNWLGTVGAKNVVTVHAVFTRASR